MSMRGLALTTRFIMPIRAHPVSNWICMWVPNIRVLTKLQVVYASLEGPTRRHLLLANLEGSTRIY